jgi:hypothetical protein
VGTRVEALSGEFLEPDKHAWDPSPANPSTHPYFQVLAMHAYVDGRHRRRSNPNLSYATKEVQGLEGSGVLFNSLQSFV